MLTLNTSITGVEQADVLKSTPVNRAWGIIMVESRVNQRSPLPPLCHIRVRSQALLLPVNKDNSTQTPAEPRLESSLEFRGGRTRFRRGGYRGDGVSGEPHPVNHDRSFWCAHPDETGYPYTNCIIRCHLYQSNNRRYPLRAFTLFTALSLRPRPPSLGVIPLRSRIPRDNETCYPARSRKRREGMELM